MLTWTNGQLYGLLLVSLRAAQALRQALRTLLLLPPILRLLSLSLTLLMPPILRLLSLRLNLGMFMAAAEAE